MPGCGLADSGSRRISSAHQAPLETAGMDCESHHRTVRSDAQQFRSIVNSTGMNKWNRLFVGLYTIASAVYRSAIPKPRVETMTICIGRTEMKKIAFVAMLVVAVLLSYSLPIVIAQESTEEAAPVSVGVTIVGQNYCLLGTLAQDEMAGANAAYAMLNGLKVAEAKDVDGNVLADLVGKTLHYLPSKAGEPLLVGEQNQNKKVTLIGKLFKNESALLVESFEAEGGGDDWDELPVGAMSGLQVL